MTALVCDLLGDDEFNRLFESGSRTRPADFTDSVLEMIDQLADTSSQTASPSRPTNAGPDTGISAVLFGSEAITKQLL